MVFKRCLCGFQRCYCLLKCCYGLFQASPSVTSRGLFVHWCWFQALPPSLQVLLWSFPSITKVFQALLHVVCSCTGVGFKRYHRLFKCCYGLFQASLRSLSVTVIVHSWSRTTLSPSIETCTAHGAVQTNHQPVGQSSCSTTKQ